MKKEPKSKSRKGKKKEDKKREKKDNMEKKNVITGNCRKIGKFLLRGTEV